MRHSPLGNSKGRFPLPSSFTVAQLNTTGASRPEAAVVTAKARNAATVNEARSLLGQLHSPQSSLTTKHCIRAIGHRAPSKAQRMRECGRILVTFTAGKPSISPQYCFIRGCQRCTAVKAKWKSRQYASLIIPHLDAWPYVYRITLTQLRIPGELPDDAYKRFVRTLSMFRQRLRAKGVQRALGFGGAVVSVETASDHIKGHHVHAHIVWIGLELDQQKLRDLWSEVSEASARGRAPFVASEYAVHVEQFDAREHPSVLPLKERLSDFVCYQLRKPFSLPENPAQRDFDVWADALLDPSTRGRRLVRTWGVLNGHTGTSPNDSDEAGEQDSDDRSNFDEGDTQEVELDVEDAPQPEIPVDLESLLDELAKSGADDPLGPRAQELAPLVKRILPALRVHVECVREARSKIPPLAPGRFLRTHTIETSEN